MAPTQEKEKSSPTLTSSAAKAIYEKGRAGYPAIFLQTSEDMRAQREIKEAAVALKRELYIYSFGKGLVKDGTSKPVPDTDNPPPCLDAMHKIGTVDGSSGKPMKAVVVLRIFGAFLEDPLVQIKLLDLIPEYKATNRMLVITGPQVKLPLELEKEFALVESHLPNKSQMNEVLDGIIETSGLKPEQKPSDPRRKELLESAMGLTTSEAENAFSLSIVRPRIEKSDNLWDPNIVMEEKCQALKKSGLLEYIPVAKEGMKQVGGLDLLKEWVSMRKEAFTDAAREYGLPPPKGILLVGPPGAGKSLSAKAISGELHMPLLRLDMGKMFGSLVGQSEANMRQAIQVAEAVSPCVLWIDEIEKGLAGSSAGSLDSGVGARVLGTILTWMQEKTSPVFVYATANDVTSLPPELLRKGRFDEMFSVTFPTGKERAEIFTIHLKKKGREGLLAKKIDLNLLVKNSVNFSGAEIETCINEALYASFAKKKELDQLDILTSLERTTPLHSTMREKLHKLDEWCKTRTRPASTPIEANADVAVTGGRMVETN